MPAPRASTDLRGEIPFSVSDHFYDRLIKRRRLPADDDGSFFFASTIFARITVQSYRKIIRKRARA